MNEWKGIEGTREERRQRNIERCRVRCMSTFINSSLSHGVANFSYALLPKMLVARFFVVLPTILFPTLLYNLQAGSAAPLLFSPTWHISIVMLGWYFDCAYIYHAAIESERCQRRREVGLSLSPCFPNVEHRNLPYYFYNMMRSNWTICIYGLAAAGRLVVESTQPPISQGVIVDLTWGISPTRPIFIS